MESSNEFLGRTHLPCCIISGAWTRSLPQTATLLSQRGKIAAGILVAATLGRAFRFAKDYWVIDGAIAAQNICLAAQELWLGAVWLGLFCCSLRRPRCSNFSI